MCLGGRCKGAGRAELILLFGPVVLSTARALCMCDACIFIIVVVCPIGSVFVSARRLLRVVFFADRSRATNKSELRTHTHTRAQNICPAVEINLRSPQILRMRQSEMEDTAIEYEYKNGLFSPFCSLKCRIYSAHTQSRTIIQFVFDGWLVGAIDCVRVQ